MTITRKTSVLAVGLVALVAASAAALDATQRITRAGLVLLDSGFELTRTLDGWLDDSEVDHHSIWLQAGVEHAFSGRCDADCSDLDLRLVNRRGTVVAESTDTSAFPAIRFTPTSNGTYRLEVIMYRCTIEPCEYDVEQYRR